MDAASETVISTISRKLGQKSDNTDVPCVAVITGPTATGKTALGIELAASLGGEIVSADSMQVYRRMDIGTAKPTLSQRKLVPHHMIDVVSPDENYSVSRYVEDASACADGILRRGKLPVIVGGTGLYIDSLISGRGFSPRGDGDARRRIAEEYDTVGGAEMLSRLRGFDEQSAARLNKNDKKRIVRAFEVFEVTGKPISVHNAESKTAPPRYRAVKVALTFRDRAGLYSGIDARVDTMIVQGLYDEVRDLIRSGISYGATSMQAIGYKEMTGVIQGRFSLSDAVLMIKTESRRLAKRQLTWLRRDSELEWIFVD